MDLQSSDISESAPEQQSDDTNRVEDLVDVSSATVSAAVLIPAHADEQLVRPSSNTMVSSDSALVEAEVNESKSTLTSAQGVAAGIFIAHLVQVSLQHG